MAEMPHRESKFGRGSSLCKCTHDQWVHNGWVGRCVACACEKYERARGNKYNARKTDLKGVVKDSRFEAQVGADLEYQKKARLIKDVRPQPKIELYAEGIHITDYKCDYEVTHLDDSIELVEAKGVETDRFRLIKKLMEIYLKHNPNVRFTVLKEKRRWFPRKRAA